MKQYIIWKIAISNNIPHSLYTYSTLIPHSLYSHRTESTLTLRSLTLQSLCSLYTLTTFTLLPSHSLILHSLYITSKIFCIQNNIYIIIDKFKNCNCNENFEIRQQALFPDIKNSNR